MMHRYQVALVWLAACSKGPGPRPDPAAFEKLTAEQQCDAVAPRCERCIDDLMIVQLRELGVDKESVDHLGEEYKRESTSPDKARAINTTLCLGSAEFAKAAFECWEQPDCVTFATCVSSKSSRPAKP